MDNQDRVVTSTLPADLASRLDEISNRIERSKSWIIRAALTEWLAEEERRYQSTLDALESVDEGRTFSQEEVLERVEQRRMERESRLQR
jgi:predicted transcriptional regulator